jgi:hypothetical protein
MENLGLGFRDRAFGRGGSSGFGRGDKEEEAESEEEEEEGEEEEGGEEGSDDFKGVLDSGCLGGR